MAIDRYILICKSKVELMKIGNDVLSLINCINRKSALGFEIALYWSSYVWLFGVVTVFIIVLDFC